MEMSETWNMFICRDQFLHHFSIVSIIIIIYNIFLLKFTRKREKAHLKYIIDVRRDETLDIIFQACVLDRR